MLRDSVGNRIVRPSHYNSSPRKENTSPLENEFIPPCTERVLNEKRENTLELNDKNSLTANITIFFGSAAFLYGLMKTYDLSQFELPSLDITTIDPENFLQIVGLICLIGMMGKSAWALLIYFLKK